jgi:type I restriction enzyme M protein
MNMFLHNINYDKFNMMLGNTLTDPHFGDDKPFDAIVSNPPYSVKWIGSDDPTLIMAKKTVFNNMGVKMLFSL